MSETTTYVRFCLNGHVVAKTGEEDNKRVCPVCGVIATYRIDNWESNDYPMPKVPKTPIGSHWMEIIQSDLVGKKKIDVFDVSNVKMWEIDATFPTVTRVCTECNEEFTLEGKFLDMLKGKFGKLRSPNTCLKCKKKIKQDSGQTDD